VSATLKKRLQATLADVGENYNWSWEAEAEACILEIAAWVEESECLFITAYELKEEANRND
jgi:hypothetical protein